MILEQNSPQSTMSQTTVRLGVMDSDVCINSDEKLLDSIPTTERYMFS
jgi:hypothetical protein